MKYVVLPFWCSVALYDFGGEPLLNIWFEIAGDLRI
jgi:hypothetical protein